MGRFGYGRLTKTFRPTKEFDVKLVAHDGKIVIQKIGGPRTTKGGLLLPETARGGKSEMGTVISCGVHDGWKEGEPRKFLPGDVVVFSAFSGSDVAIAGEDYLCMQISDVLARLEGWSGAGMLDEPKGASA